MLKVALTGGIATGKSYVLDRFRQLGVPCLDADELAHGVTAAGHGSDAGDRRAVRPGHARRRGRGRSGQARRRSSSPTNAARRDLEAIVHPAVYRAITAGLRAFELLEKPPLAIVDIPLLYETGRAGDFDRVIATVCSPATQLARLADRGLTELQARQRLSAQMPADEKAARADFVIRTDGTFDETDAQVEKIWGDAQTLATGFRTRSSIVLPEQ